MVCSKCGKENKDSSKFCKACGTPLVNAEKTEEKTAAPPEKPAGDKEPEKEETVPEKPKPRHTKVKVKAKPKPKPETEKEAAERAKAERITVHKGEFVIVKPGEDNLSGPDSIQKMKEDLLTKQAEEKKAAATPEPAAEEIRSEYTEEEKAQAQALAEEANRHYRGIQCPIDEGKAYQLFEQAFQIHGNNLLALRGLLNKYNDLDDKRCLDFANKLAALGDARGYYFLADCYEAGRFCEKNVNNAITLLKKGVEQNDLPCAELLLAIYEDNFGEQGNIQYINYLKPLAENNNPVALLQLYRIYSEGIKGVPANSTFAMECMNKALQLNFPAAYCDYAMDSFYGNSCIKKDIATGRQHLDHAVSLNDCEALLKQGVFYSGGLFGYPENSEAAIRNFERVVENGHDDLYFSALDSLGLELRCSACEENQARATSYIEMAAKHGETGSLNSLASSYLYGFNGYEKNLPKAIANFEKAADNGSIVAMYDLGRLYLDGADGSVSPDPVKGVEWLCKAAENDHGMAAEEVADYYYNGQFVAKDLQKARHFYVKGAQEGMAKSMFLLGVMNEEGEGGPKAFKAAEYWYKQLAESGADENGIGKCNLGRLYLYKMGRYREALPMFNAAIHLGNTDAMYYTALCHAHGWGTPINLQTAEYWMNMAAQRGNAEALHDLPIIRQMISEGCANYTPAPLPTPQTDDSGKSGGKQKRVLNQIVPTNKTQRSYTYKDPGMDPKQAGKIVGLTIAFFVIGLFLAIFFFAAVAETEYQWIALPVAYAISALPLSIIRLKGLRANGNKGEFGAAGGYLVGGGSEGNGCTMASAFLISRWLINWIICIFALLYWFPKSIVALVRNSNNKKVR